MKIEEIKTIVKLMSEHDLTEFKIEAEECNLCIRRGCSSPAPVVTQIAAPMPAAPAVAAAAPAPAAAAEAPKAAPAETIDSPLVGTFYRAPSPGAAPFIEVGDHVKKGQVIGIIEAMKLLNEVEADQDGVVKAFAAENGQPVEFGQPLVSLD